VWGPLEAGGCRRTRNYGRKGRTMQIRSALVTHSQVLLFGVARANSGIIGPRVGCSRFWVFAALPAFVIIRVQWRVLMAREITIGSGRRGNLIQPLDARLRWRFMPILAGPS
jgi:hypothetical protein